MTFYNVKYFKEIKRLKVFSKGLLEHLSEGASTIEHLYEHLRWSFLWICWKAFYFCNESSIIDVRLSYIEAYKNNEISKMKLRWSKLSRLLQRVAFLVMYLAKRFVYYISAVHFFRSYSRLTKFFSTNLLTQF